MSIPQIRRSLGLAAFDFLRAEEEPWLAEVFVPPADFPLWSGLHSLVLYGEGGGGKTTVLHMIRHHASSPIFFVPWQPHFESNEDPSDPAIWLQKLLQACATALRNHLAHQTGRWDRLPDWARDFLRGFFHRYREPFWEIEYARLKASLDESGQRWLEQVFSTSPPAYDIAHFTPVRLLQYLVEVIGSAGWQGLWIMADGLQMWEPADETTTQRPPWQGLRELFGYLAFFDQRFFTFKLAVPLSWRASLQNASAIRTRRLEEYVLEWTQDELLAIVNKRLALATGTERRLEDLGPDCKLPDWFRRYAGTNPRRWLILARDLLWAYEQAGNRPLTPATWRQLSRRLTPSLYLKSAEPGVVYVGSHRVELPHSLYQVLAYLYSQDRVCSRDELYFIAYKALPKIPRPGEAGWEEPSAWRGVIDTVLWRLRRSIEPNPDQPLFIQTVRGQGIKLTRVRSDREIMVR
jgi:hypothetical protein